MIKLKIHSIVDVITNSSTVIYTYQGGFLSLSDNKLYKSSFNLTEKKICI